uniref:Uncharacterized protein n=1 Tax=Acrobeloides nanus TaxID=290746 RepID=A0A914CV31_9BILA
MHAMDENIDFGENLDEIQNLQTSQNSQTSQMSNRSTVPRLHILNELDELERQAENSNENMVSPKLNHPVWTEEACQLTEDKNGYRCFSCNRIFKGRNTQNAMRHLSVCSKANENGTYAKVKAAEIERIEKKKEKEKSKPKNSPQIMRREQKNKYRLLYLLLGMVLSGPTISLNSFLDSSMHAIFRVLDPRFQLPISFTGLKTCLNDAYDLTKACMIEEFKSVKYYCAMIDIWSEKSMKRSYIGVTIHYAKNCELRTAFLGVVYLTEQHTGDYIRKTTIQLLNNFSIREEQVVKFISDWASNMKRAFRNDIIILRAPDQDFEFNEDNDYEDTEFDEIDSNLNIVLPKWLGCIVHQLQLCIACKTTRELVDPITEKLLNLLKKVKKSNLLHQSVSEETGLSVLVPPTTRWCYIFITLERAFQLKVILKQIADPDEYPDEDEWKQLSYLRNIYHCFYSSIMKLQGEKTPIIGLVYPEINGILAELSKHNTTLSKHLLEQVKTRFEHVIDWNSSKLDMTFCTTTFLDPNLSFFINEDYQISRVINHIIRLAGRDVDSRNSNSVDNPYELPVNSPASSNSYALEMLAIKRRKIEENRSGTSLQHFLRQYAQTVLPPQPPLNPMLYWHSYPPNEIVNSVKDVVDQLFITSPSSAPMERGFSNSGDNTSRKRNRTAPDLLNMKMVTYLNKSFLEKHAENLENNKL